MKFKFRSLSRRRIIEVLIISSFLSLILVLASCRHRPLSANEDDEILIPPGNDGGGNGGGVFGIPCDPDSVYFQNTILPLLISNCAKSGCHDAGTAQERIILDSYANVMASGEITPFNPSEGDIMEAITETDPDKIMPPPGNTPLSPQQINQLSQWIAQGAQNNGCSNCDTLNITYSGKVKPLIDLKCKGCHSGSNPPYGIDLSGYGGLQAVALAGSLMGSLNHATGYSPMPKGSAKLPDCELSAIRIWVDAGAPNN